MKNDIPNSIPALLAMAGKASNGAGQYPALLVLNTKATVDVDVTALTDAIMAYGTGKNLLSDHRDSVAASVNTSRQFVMLGRDNFKPFFGNEHNSRWDVTGLAGSLAIPYSAPKMLLVLRSFNEFLTDNPAMEVAGKDITALHAADLHTELNAASAAMDTQAGVVDNLLVERNAKAESLRTRVSNLITELKMSLDGLDGRWAAFGLNKPDGQQTPDQVDQLQASLMNATVAELKWNRAARAEYYHVFKKVQGVDLDYILVGSPADLDFTIENLPAGATIDIVVTAVNKGGDGAKSEKVTLVTHAS